MVDESLTLQQLDGQDWGDPATAPTDMVARCLYLRRSPLHALSPGDVRLLIGQKIGLETLVPRAIRLISHRPFLHAEYYPGDLLSALLRVDQCYWRDHPAAFEQIVRIAHSVAPRGGDVANQCQAFLADSDR